MTRTVKLTLVGFSERLALYSGYAILAFCALSLADGKLGRLADMSAFESEAVQTRHTPKVMAIQRTRRPTPPETPTLFAEMPVAVLEIDAVKILVPVYADTGSRHLNRGAGLIAGMAAPGDGGNLGVAAHRDTYFRPLMNLQLGDIAAVRANGRRFLYRIASISIVPANDTKSLAKTDKPTLTLVTCFPFYYLGHAPQRFVAHALLESTIDDEALSSRSTGDPRT